MVATGRRRTPEPEGPAFGRVKAVCARCLRVPRSIVGGYREFLLDPATLFTLASGLVLIAAIVADPRGVVSSSGEGAGDGVLYVVAALVGSVFIWWSAIQGLRRRDFTADIPVSVATAAAIGIGQYSAAAVVAVLLLLGGLLENLVAARADNALQALARLLPDEVTVRRDGQDLVVPLEALRVGEVMLVRPAQRIAVDGRVRSGLSLVDQAAITGESVPVDKGPGDEVFAGTLNGVGALEIGASRVGEETTLGQVRRMVAEAQRQKAPIERVLDRYAKLYTPVALVLAGVLWLWTGHPLRAITMLIVFCPCVMVLATPTALVASIGNAALRGSLVKKGATVEGLARVDAVVFDKTGTLTLGEPALIQVVALDGVGSKELLRVAAVAEKFSEHPLGRAVVRAAMAAGLEVPDPEEFEALAGVGVRAVTGGRQVLLGRTRLLAERGVDVAELDACATAVAADGRTVVSLAVDRRAAGVLVLEDALRPQAEPTVRRLKALQLRTLLVTGDQHPPAERIAARLGVDEMHAEVLPQEKVAVVKGLRAAGSQVAFVGDGVNDGPALATADVGVAMGAAGTDVAIETADIALLSDDLSKLPHLLRLSKQAMKAIRQNLVFSVGVLAVAVGLTVVGILTPVTGALLHELSSIPVIANSARLIRHRGRAALGAG